MAQAYAHLVAQQLADVRPSPTLEVQKQLYPTPSPSPALDANSGNAPPTKPFAPQTRSRSCSPGHEETEEEVQQTPAKKAPKPVVLENTTATSSPKGANDIFSMNTDQQLAERYKFVEEIGFGNWGSVWKVTAKQGPHAGKAQAVKLVFRMKEDKTTPARVRSVWQEFKVIRAFKANPHPNIIRFYDFIICPSYALVVMDIHAKLMPTNVPESTARAYFQQLLSGVDYLHTHGVTHNDIKPANILLSNDERPIIVDFGFANRWSLESEHASSAFMSSLSWGTPEYLSPERSAQKMHDERLSDIWSLGVTMYEIVVGRTPFEKDTSEEFLTKEALEVYYKRTLAGSFYGTYKISLAFEDLVRQMVEPSIANRLPSCAKGMVHPFFSLRPPSVMVSEPKSAIPVFSPVNATYKKPAVAEAPSTKATTKLASTSYIARPVVASATASKPAHREQRETTVLSPIASPAQPPAPAPTPITSPVSGSDKYAGKTGQALKAKSTNTAARKPVANAPAGADKKAEMARSPAKRKEIKIYQDGFKAPPPPAAGQQAGTTSAGKPGLRPLLLRAGSVQSLRSPATARPTEPLPPTPTPTPLGTSSPAKVLGNVSTNVSSKRVSVKSPVGTPKKPLAATRDSKELRSPSSIRPVEGDKENVGGASGNRRTRSPLKARAVKASDAAPFSTNTVPLPDAEQSASFSEVRPSSKLSKRRPSESKLNKSTSSISFSSLSSSFRAKSRQSMDKLRGSESGKAVPDDYAIVERDGRVSFEGDSRLVYLREDVLHITAQDSERQEVIQERIISPEAQREYGRHIEQQHRLSLERSTSSNSMSSSSASRLPFTTPSPQPQPGAKPVASHAKITRGSLAPSFAARAASAASNRTEEDRCESRQSDVSDSSACTDVDQEGDATIHHHGASSHHLVETIAPAITVSRPKSMASSAPLQIRSCWSPETCPSDTETSESEYSEQPRTSQHSHERTSQQEEDEEETMHAAPQFRRNSAVFTRSPRAESIYQSFICPAPEIEIPAPARISPSPQNTSLNATWGASSRAAMTPSPDIHEHYRNLHMMNNPNQSQYSLFPPPDDLRSLASPPPRPDTAASRRTLTKMKSWLGKFGLGSRR